MIDIGSSEAPARILDKIMPEPNSGCWLWMGTRHMRGYGQVHMGHHQYRYAHRVVYEYLVGPVADALELDHLCRVKLCVNPRHLEPVTHRENVMRGEGVAPKRAAMSTCMYGHEFDAANTRHVMKGGRLLRQCRACQKQYAARWYRTYGRRRHAN